MKRKAFKMFLYEDCAREYIAIHNPVWEVLKTTLKEHGVYNYSLFLDRSNHTLFGYVEIESEEQWQKIAETDICKKWWAYMADMMETNDDNSPVSHTLEEVFHID